MPLPFDLAQALWAALFWPPAWLGWGLATAALLASLRPRPDGLPLHLLLAAAQSSALVGTYIVYVSICWMSCQSPPNFMTLAIGDALALQVPVAAVAPAVLIRCRLSWGAVWPGPALSTACGLAAFLLAIFGAGLALTTPFGAWPTWADFAGLFP